MQLLQHVKGETSQKNQQDRTKNESKPKRPPTVTENQLKNQIDRGAYEGVNHYYARHFTLFYSMYSCVVLYVVVCFLYLCIYMICDELLLLLWGVGMVWLFVILY